MCASVILQKYIQSYKYILHLSLYGVDAIFARWPFFDVFVRKYYTYCNERSSLKSIGQKNVP